MRKPWSSLFVLLVGVSLGAPLLMPESGRCQNHSDSTISSPAKTSASYLLARYVIGSGGVIGAKNNWSIHFATAGETVAGSMHNTKHHMLSSFWRPGGLLPTAIDPGERPHLPKTFALHQNYPNPFNPQTTIAYEVPVRCTVTIEIFNAVGQRLNVLRVHHLKVRNMARLPGTVRMTREPQWPRALTYAVSPQPRQAPTTAALEFCFTKPG